MRVFSSLPFCFLRAPIQKTSRRAVGKSALIATIVVAAAVSGCEDPDQFFAVAQFSPPILDLGPIAFDAECEAVLQLENGGNRDLEVAGARLINSSGDFSLVSKPEFVGLGTSGEVRVKYVAAGTLDERQSVVVQVDTNAGSPEDGVAEATLTAIPTEGTAAVALTGCDDAIPCTGVEFGAVQIDDPTVPVEQRQGLTKTMQIINDGTAPLEVFLVAVQNGNPDFIISGLRKGNLLVETPVILEPGRTSDCGAAIDSQDNILTIDVYYSPTAIGLDNDEVTIVTDSVENNSLTIPVTGTGSDIGILPTPSYVNFGSLGEGNTNTVPVNIANLGTSDAAVNTSCIDLGGDGTCDVDCTGTADTLSCIVKKNDGAVVGKGFILTPTDATAGGSDEHTIEITWSPVAGDAAIPVGTVLRLETNLLGGRAWEVPVVGGSAGIVTLGSDDLCGERVCVSASGVVDDVSTWTGTATFTLTNTGDASLDVSSFVWDGPATIIDDFELQDEGGTPVSLDAPAINLAPGAAVSLTIDYANNDASGADFVNLEIHHTGIGGKTILPLQISPPAE
ncbi:MAG: hypothetical protein GY822_16515 [Deltaproteobacteria bacterium]|nr:hypothetical protein [Deltaproteobacteria bacterium]